MKTDETRNLKESVIDIIKGYEKLIDENISLRNKLKKHKMKEIMRWWGKQGKDKRRWYKKDHLKRDGRFAYEVKDIQIAIDAYFEFGGRKINDKKAD